MINNQGKQPQKASQKPKSWPIPNDLPTTAQIYDEILSTIPELKEYQDKNPFCVFVVSYYHLINREENWLFKKMIEENKKGISMFFVIDIFWYYQKDIILNILKYRTNLYRNPIKIGARQIKIKEIAAKEANRFLETYHAHGVRASSIKLGIYYKDELVSVMSFGKPFLSGNAHNVDLEFHRHCVKPNYTIIGLIDKVMKYLLNNYKVETVLHYKENLYYNDAEARTKDGYKGESGVTSYYVINNTVYPRVQAMNMKGLEFPVVCYDKIPTPGSSIFIMKTRKMEDMF